jgi:methylaspartate ammonia-lyase
MTLSGKPPKNAILIGEGKWIEFIDLTGRYDVAIDIDPLLADLEPLWSALETQCVAACCGLDAFDFYPDNIASAMDNIEISSTCQKLMKLRSSLDNLGSSVVVSRRLNNYADIAVFNALVSHVQSHLCA